MSLSPEENFRSYTKKKWQLKEFDERITELIVQKYNLDYLLAKLFSIRNIDIDEIHEYINPSLKDHMPDPSILEDMNIAIERVVDGIKKNEKIAVFGDYDVDGSTSCSILVNYFKKINIDILFHIPNRFTEGYGPNIESFKNFKSKDVSIIFTVDCGTMSFDEMSFSKQEKLDVIILDHHQAEINLPEAYAVINPNRIDDKSGLTYLSAAGVTFMFLIALNRKLRNLNWFEENNIKEPNLLVLLDLVALSTICDAVPLKGLNRLFVLKGLEVMNRKHNHGLNALIEKSAIKSKVSSYDLGFKLGPRINAAGRLGNSSYGTDLLTASDDLMARELASKLDHFNQERKTIESYVLEKADQQVTDDKLNKNIIIVAGEDWHEGVIGIIASRLKDKYGKPCIVISINGNQAKGSGRSIKGIDLGSLVIAAKQSNIIENGGGHSMAAGLSLMPEKVLELEEFLDKRLQNVSPIFFSNEKCLNVDSEISSSGINLDVYDNIEKLGPFGSNNPEPTFVIKNALLADVKIIGDNHLKCLIKNNTGFIEAMAFRSLKSILGDELQKNKGNEVSLLGKIKVNEWGGRRTPQFFIEDIAEQIQ